MCLCPTTFDDSAKLPARGATTEGFDMGMCWNDHTRGLNAALFRAGLAANEAARPHYDAAMAAHKARKAKRAERQGTKRKEPA